MSATPDLDPRILDRFLADEASSVERAQVAAWAAADPRNAALLATLRGAFGEPDDLPDTNASWHRLAARLESTAPPRRLWVRSAMRIAAGFILVAGGVTAWHFGREREHTLEAPLGRRVTATLSDGTQVTLGAGSRARWSSRFGGTTRDVALEGEGYFVVTHDTTRPFRVRARNGVVEDVGTRFVVRAWPELARLEVAVEEGAAAVSDTATARVRSGVVLVAGQVGRLARNGEVEVAAGGESSLAWAHGGLAFDDTPLSEALPALSRWYDVELRADSTLASRRLTARFANQSLSEMLDALSVALATRVVREGRVVVLSPLHQ